MRRIWRWLLVVGSLLTIAPLSFAQERYAILVGVGQYPGLDASLQLQGPPNDVLMAREYLLLEGFEEDRIVWLSDNAPTPPLRVNILDALKDLDEKLQEGDFVLLHFAGHGSRQPAKPDATEELDGYDEIFLPADVKGWNMDIGAVENAITDDEIGAFIGSYRRKGADVWVIFDSCHSGTMTRGVGDDSVRARMVPDTALGIPEFSASDLPMSAAEPQTPAFVDGVSGVERGMLVAFSAAHTSEEAPEMSLPRRSPQAKPLGLLSHSIYTVLSRFPAVSYRQLAQLVSDQYVAVPWLRSRPQFYGTDMDRVVLNGTGTRPSLFRAKRDKDNDSRLTVSAGALRGFDIDAGIAVYEDASGVEDTLLGIGTVVTAMATEAVAKVDWHQGDEVSASRHIPVYARLVQPAYETRVLIARLDTARNEDNQRLQEIIADMETHVPLVNFRAYDAEADYFAAFFDEKFWLLRPGQTLPCAARTVDNSERAECERARQPENLFWSTAEDAQRLVSKAAKVRSLTKLQGAVGLPGSLSVDVQVQRPKQDEPVSFADIDGPLHAGDQLYYSVRNQDRSPWDVFLFYVDSRLGIQALQEPGQSARVLPDEKIDTRLLGTVNDRTTGLESLVIIVEPVREGLEADYSFLAQDSHLDVTLRSVGQLQSPLQATLEGLLSAEPGGARARGLDAAAHATGSQGQVKVFTWTVE